MTEQATKQSTDQAILEGRKIFVGNLAFSTTEEELSTAVKGTSDVESVVIIKRGSRSLGYGFVTYKQKKDAEQAAAKLNQVTLSGRVLNVELAKPKEPRVAKPASTPAAAAEKTEGADADAAAQKRRRRRNNKPRKPKSESGEQPVQPVNNVQPAYVNPHAQNNNNNATNASTNNHETAAPARRGRGGRHGGRGGRRGGFAGNDQGVPIEKRTPHHLEGVPSDTALFVANLPFSVDDKALSDLFSRFHVTKAHVVHKANGLSKGFGFVNVSSPADQQRALSEMQGHEVQGRALTVKQAVEDQLERAETYAKERAQEQA